MLDRREIKQVAVGIALAASASVAMAAPITGDIGFGGNTTVYTDTTMSTSVSDFTEGTVLDFVDNRALVAMDPTGTFAEAGLSYGDLATTADYLTYDPTSPIDTGGSPLWSVGGFSFHLEDLTVMEKSAGALFLKGSGHVSGEGYDDTPYSWAYSSQNGFTFSSASSPTASVPEASSLALMGIGLLGVGMTRLRKAA